MQKIAGIKCVEMKNQSILIRKIGFEPLNPLGANHPKMKKCLFSIVLIHMLDVFMILFSY